MASYNEPTSFLDSPTMEGLDDSRMDVEAQGFEDGLESSFTAPAGSHFFSSTQYTTAQSRVLHNQDLIYFILSSLSPSSSTSKSLASVFFDRDSPPLPAPSLLAAALTCRCFFNPAMRVVWCEATLTSLLRVIPVLIKIGGTYTLDDVIKDEYLNRLDLYARHIRRLYVINETFPTEIYAIISRLRHSTLLPAIKMLKFSSTVDSSLQNVGSLLLATSPTLSRVQIGPIDPTSNILVASFMQGLSIGALEWLHLEGSLTTITFNLLPRFLRLTYLCLAIQHPKRVDIFGICSKITMLRTLNLKIGASEWAYKGPSTAVKFDSLRHLHLSATVPSMVNLLVTLQAIPIPNLLTLNLRFLVFTATPGLQVTKCIESCARIAQSTALSSLMLSAPLMINSNILAPLQCLDRLTKFTLLFSVLSVTNNDILRFLGHGQALERIKITFGNGGSVASALTPSVLGIFAKNCPRLTSLTLSVHIKTDQISISMLENEMDRLDTPQNRLTTLRIFLVPPTDDHNLLERDACNVISAAVVSRYINYCFPKLEIIHVNDAMKRPRPEDVDWAKGVEKMVQSYHEMRKRTSA